MGVGWPERAGPRRGAAGGGLGLRRRRSGGLGQRRVGRGVPAEGEEADCGVEWAQGRPEEGAPWEPRGRRRPWWTAAAVPGKGGTRGLALELRRGEGESEDVSELAGKVLAVLGERRGEARSAGSARRRCGALATILGVCAGGGAAWRGRADWRVRFGRTR